VAWANRRQGTRQERGYGREWELLRAAVLDRDKWLCQPCARAGRIRPLGDKPRDAEVDHIIPKHRGGSDEPSNLEAIMSGVPSRKDGV
jgi:5-methylcytosine-specific restriction protein A